MKMLFIGVTTGKSSMMSIFPQWAKILNIDAELIGYDVPLNAPPQIYRTIVEAIKADSSTAGALVTTHKLDLFSAAHDLFDEFDVNAALCREVSSIYKQGDKLIGAAVDTHTSGLTLESFVPPQHWSKTEGEVLCLGAGGAATAISVYFASQSDPPLRFIAVDRSIERLNGLRDIHSRLHTSLLFEYILNEDPTQNDHLLSALPSGSMVINATGMGKDRPGSPITDGAIFPQDGLVWELNYRGAVDFLHQAKRQENSRHLIIEDGWRYFLYGWSEVMAQVFHLDLTPELFAQLSTAAESIRA